MDAVAQLSRINPERPGPATVAQAERGADAARASLARRGFAALDGVFTDGDLAEAHALIDELVDAKRAAVMRSGPERGRAMLQDMSAAGVTPGDQPELLYPGSLAPRLMRSGVFRKARALAAAITGAPMSRSFDHAIIKAAGNRSTTPWHQDAALSRLIGLPRALYAKRLHFWIPMRTVTTRSGCMEFVSGSHAGPILPHFETSRATGKGGLATEPVAPYERTACPVEAGGLTIHTPTTLHYTGPNEDAEPRVAWIIHFSRTGAAEIALKRLFGRAPGRLLPG